MSRASEGTLARLRAELAMVGVRSRQARLLGEIGEVEESGGVADGVVLGGLAVVSERHQPAGEVGHRRAEPLVHRAKRCVS